MAQIGRGAVVRFVETGVPPANPDPPDQPSGVQTITNPGSPLVLLTSRYAGFRLNASAAVLLAAPDAGAPGQALRIRFAAVGAPRQLTFDEDVWDFGSTFTADDITPTAAGTADWFGATFDAPTGRWAVVAYARGFPA
ncbi:hypothetical protein [Actinomycetospora sp. CA-053990]|uniref:hypothetical protein n=1 Tax=Actinomycetospora sp. CA-053990 TaxID=3239891 RepID=UPI003D89D9B5